jgi:hypothetical protein
MVSKDPESPYVGGRTLKWLKVKVPKYREEERVLQAGWLTRFTVRGRTILLRVAVHFRTHQLPGRETSDVHVMHRQVGRSPVGTLIPLVCRWLVTNHERL